MDRLAERSGAALLGIALTILFWSGSAYAHAGEDHSAESGGLSAIEIVAVAAIIAVGLIFRSARRRTS